MAGRIAVVDEGNAFVRWEDRIRIHEERLIHRSIHVLVFDSRDRLLVQRRHPDKQTHPNMWDTSCAGHVEESDYTAGPDEDLDAVYREVARREVMEELGVEVALTELGHFAPEAGVHYEQIRLFRGVSDGPFTLQPDEVSEVKQVTRPALSALEPTTDALRWFVDWLCERDLWR